MERQAELNELATELRQKQTQAESRVWSSLRNGRLGHKFRRQHPIDKYILDFVCLEQKLVIEIDGGQHQPEIDAARTNHITQQGFTLLRFWNHDVLRNLEGVMHQIKAALPPHPEGTRLQTSPTRGEVEKPKRKKLPVNGWLNLWKPYGMSSMQAVARARSILNAAKAGHAGTLDPLAEGILPIAFGEATKLIPLLHESSKSYRFTVKWGTQTHTDDAEGDGVATSPHRPGDDAIIAALPRFTGMIDQVPPAFSAIKINGVRSYAAARAGQEVTLAARPVRIEAFALIARPDADTAVFEVTCGTGTYVRSLARDLALALGTVGHCTQIIRISVGVFNETESILLENLTDMAYTEAQATLWPLAKALDDILAVAITDTEAQRLQRGQDVSFISKMDNARLADLPMDGRFLAVHGDRIVAICRRSGATLHPERVLNT